jgi:hypothetical protein
MKAFSFLSSADRRRRRRHWHAPWYDRRHRRHNGYWYWGY